MRWIRNASVLGAVMVAILVGAGAPARAAVPPQNVGWLYTASGSGAVFFDADLTGYPSFEKITVCDNTSDSRGIVAVVSGRHPEGGDSALILRDPSNDGNCAAQWQNYFADGYAVGVTVCEYWGNNEDNCRSDSGVA